MNKTLRIGAAPHSFDGSSYYRMWLPFLHLTNNSHHIIGVHSPAEGDLDPRTIEGHLDVLTLQRPCGPMGAHLLESLLGKVKLVYEVDDDMLNVEAAGLPHLDDDRVRESIRRCVRMCDMVTVTNEYLAEIYRPFNDNVVILPNHIKQSALDIVRPRRDRLTIGWAGGTSHLWDMVEIADPLQTVLDCNDVDMHFVGFDFSPLLRRHCRTTGWQKDVGHYYKQIDFDIAVAPSADQLFNRGKTPLRALEMGALGIPIVASNRLPYSDYVIDGKTGFLCDSEQQWADRLCELIGDPNLREEMGRAAKEQAAQWTIEDGWRLWEQAFELAAE